MTEKEKEIQKALGTFPTFVCSNCGKESFIDEKYTYTDRSTLRSILNIQQLCRICATAQFVCNKILKKPMGKFTKEDE